MVLVGVKVEVGVEVEVDVDTTLSFRHSLDGVQILFRVDGWVAGWLEKRGLKLISTQVVVEVEVGVELGNILQNLTLASCTYLLGYGYQAGG